MIRSPGEHHHYQQGHSEGLKVQADELKEQAQRIEDLGNTLENGLSVICESLGISTEHYDTDQADTECYLDCFKDAAAIIKKFRIEFDDETGEFIKTKR